MAVEVIKMAWRIVKQPNGLYARFSEIVDDFTEYDMTKEETISICINQYDCGKQTAEDKIQRAVDNPGRYEEAMDIVEKIHGKKEVEERRAMLTAKSL